VADLKAKIISEMFDNYLIKNNINHILQLSNEYRFDIDYNRNESFDSEWRQFFRKKINSLLITYDKIFVLEIHSYPNDTPSFPKNKDMIIMNNNFTKKNGLILNKYLQNKNFDVEFVEGNYQLNDIQHELTLTSEKIIPFLLEFNENERLSDYYFENLIETIIEHLNNTSEINKIINNTNFTIINLIINFIKKN